MRLSRYQRLRWLRRLSVLMADQRGASAVSFVLVAMPFFMLLFGILEIAFIFTMSSVLDHSVRQASRDLRTGAFHTTAKPTADAFRNRVCESTFSMLTGCGSRLSVDVRVLEPDEPYNPFNPIDPSGGLDPEAFTFRPAESREVVVVNAVYRWKLLTPVLTRPLANLGDDTRVLRSTVAFKNEPF